MRPGPHERATFAAQLPAAEVAVAPPDVATAPHPVPDAGGHVESPRRPAAARLGSLARAFAGHYREPRVLGLDLMRIFASLTIVLFHVSNHAAYDGVGPLKDGYLAVDVFFVLSGWLLTRQAIRVVRRSRETGGAFALRFWGRRWLRTIPAYWVALVALSILAGQGVVSGPTGFPALIRHALFLQEALRPNLYGVSWSLVAEEWFYLLLPFVVFASLWLRRPRLVVGAALIALLVPTAVRAVLVGSMSWIHLRVLPEARFEGLVVGSALAAMSLCAPAAFAVLSRHRRPLALLALAGLVGLLVLHRRDTWLFIVPGVLAINVLLGCLIPFLSGLRWPAGVPAAVVMGTTFLSDLTYPLYLVHTICYDALGRSGLVTGRTAGVVVSLVGVFVVAIALHLTVERPVLALRTRLLGAGTAAV